MSRFFYQLTALCLALLWMPLTLCCSAEAAIGDEFSLCSDRCCDGTSPGEQRDNCALVEDGDYSGFVTHVRISDPAAAGESGGVFSLLAFAPPPRPARVMMPPEPERSRGWVATWQFERRAAAPAHAPDLTIG